MNKDIESSYCLLIEVLQDKQPRIKTVIESDLNKSIKDCEISVLIDYINTHMKFLNDCLI